MDNLREKFITENMYPEEKRLPMMLSVRLIKIYKEKRIRLNSSLTCLVLSQWRPVKLLSKYYSEKCKQLSNTVQVCVEYKFLMMKNFRCYIPVESSVCNLMLTWNKSEGLPRTWSSDIHSQRMTSKKMIIISRSFPSSSTHLLILHKLKDNQM